jgi:hypothetical protein
MFRENKKPPPSGLKSKARKKPKTGGMLVKIIITNIPVNTMNG